MKASDKQSEVQMITGIQSRDDFGNASFSVCTWVIQCLNFYVCFAILG